MASLLKSKKTMDDFIDCIASGMTISASCNYVMIDNSTWTKFRQRAEMEIEQGLTDEQSVYVAFYHRFKKAEAQFQRKHIKNIEDFGEKTWQASAWLLERKFPDDFGNRQNVNFDDAKVTIVNDVPKDEN